MSKHKYKIGQTLKINLTLLEKFSDMNLSDCYINPEMINLIKKNNLTHFTISKLSSRRYNFYEIKELEGWIWPEACMIQEMKDKIKSLVI
jgi:hypothetical protein